MHRKPFPPKPLVEQFADNEKTDAAEDYQRAGYQVESDVASVRGQALSAAEDVKTRVVERRDGVKKADAYRPAERKFARKNAKGKRIKWSIKKKSIASYKKSGK